AQRPAPPGCARRRAGHAGAASWPRARCGSPEPRRGQPLPEPRLYCCHPGQPRHDPDEWPDGGAPAGRTGPHAHRHRCPTPPRRPPGPDGPGSAAADAASRPPDPYPVFPPGVPPSDCRTCPDRSGSGDCSAVTLGEHLVGVTHALEHDIEEQRLELAGYPLHVLGTVGLTAGLHLGHGVEVGVAETRTVHVSTPQITIRSAFSAPACLSASRMAIRSPGAAPTWLTARTISSSDTPGLNTNMRPSPSSILTWELGVTTVWPPLKGSGWLT